MEAFSLFFLFSMRELKRQKTRSMLSRESRSYSQRHPSQRRSHGESQPTTLTTLGSSSASTLLLYRTLRSQGCIFFHVPMTREFIQFISLASSNQAKLPRNSPSLPIISRQLKEKNASLAAERPSPSMLTERRTLKSSSKTTSAASLRPRWRRDGHPHPLKAVNSRSSLLTQTTCSRSRTSHSTGSLSTQKPSRELRKQRMHSKANKPRLFE